MMAYTLYSGGKHKNKPLKLWSVNTRLNHLNHHIFCVFKDVRKNIKNLETRYYKFQFFSLQLTNKKLQNL